MKYQFVAKCQDIDYPGDKFRPSLSWHSRRKKSLWARMGPLRCSSEPMMIFFCGFNAKALWAGGVVSNSDIIHIGEKQFRISFDIFMRPCFDFVIDDAYLHFAGMQIDTAMVLVPPVVKSHRLASFE